MNLKRTTIIFVGGAAFAAWLSAAIAPGRPPAASVPIAPAPIDARGAALATEVARLRARLRPGVAPLEATRNPFLFRSPRRGASSSRPLEQESDGVAAALAARGPVRGRLTLAGVAEDPGPGGGAPVRTAIISGNGQLFLAREGDTVTDGNVAYRVGTISADSAELALPDGTVRRLTLK